MEPDEQRRVPVIAAYDGRCSLCGGDIDENISEIVNVEGEWVHAECAEGNGYEVAW